MFRSFRTTIQQSSPQRVTWARADRIKEESTYQWDFALAALCVLVNLTYQTPLQCPSPPTNSLRRYVSL